MGLSARGEETVTITVTVVSVFSAIGSLFIIWSYLRYSALRKVSFQLVCWLALCDIGGDIAFFVGVGRENDAACVIQAVLLTFFQLASVLWTTVIAHTLFRTVILQQPGANMSSYHTFVWGISLVMTVLPATTNSYGNSEGWCWINASSQQVDVGVILRYFTFYVPLWMAFIYNLATYVRISRKVKLMMNMSTSSPDTDDTAKSLARLTDRLKYYPLILVFCFAVATVHRIRQSAVGPSPAWLVALAGGMMQLQGVCNAMAYGYNIFHQKLEKLVARAAERRGCQTLCTFVLNCCFQASVARNEVLTSHILQNNNAGSSEQVNPVMLAAEAEAAAAAAADATMVRNPRSRAFTSDDESGDDGRGLDENSGVGTPPIPSFAAPSSHSPSLFTPSMGANGSLGSKSMASTSAATHHTTLQYSSDNDPDP